jgi:hypothetical protein
MKFTSLAIVLGSTLVAASAALAAPVSNSLSYGVSITTIDGFSNSETNGASWVGTPSVIQAATDVSAFDDAGNQNEVFASGISAVAADGNSGIFNINYGWYAIDAASVYTNLAGPDWSYTFVADQTGQFTLNYGVVANGSNFFGLQGFSVSDNFANTTGYPVENAFDPDTSGTLVGDITQGQSYTISVQNDGNVYGGTIDATSDVEGTFSFNITGSGNSVPDQGSTLLLAVISTAALICVERRFRRVRS